MHRGVEAVPGLSLADAYSAASRVHSEVELPGLADDQYLDRDGTRGRVGDPGRWAWGGMALGVFALGALSVFAVMYAGSDTPHYATGVGEQRSVVLADGSRLSLNTSTEVDVSLTPERRTVRIVSGEAFSKSPRTRAARLSCRRWAAKWSRSAPPSRCGCPSRARRRGPSP
ncbi:FecR domain-containing protein [Roseateles chitinivorans]|uniref:FecR domain-containing protein n=1 Tax=Roseateles chitinivorans TaxID=2917965 RepID=UPI003D67FC74